MIRSCWLVGTSAALFACHPSVDGKTRPTTTATASAPSAIVSGTVVSALPTLAKLPVPEAEADSGVAEESVTKVVCGRRAPPHCRFQGRVRSMRPVALAPEDQPIDPHDLLTRATEVVLDDVSSLECANLQLGGVQQASREPGKPDRREGPGLWQEGEMPVARALLVTLRSGLHLPFAEGEIICGSVTVFTAGLGGKAHEAVVARPNGDVLLAYAADMPREASPTPGWTFTFGPKRTFGRKTSNYDMVVSHNGVSISTPFEGKPALLRAPDGEFIVEGSGYVRAGTRSDAEETYSGYLAKRGYGFSIVRAAPGSQPDPSQQATKTSDPQ